MPRGNRLNIDRKELTTRKLRRLEARFITVLTCFLLFSTSCSYLHPSTAPSESAASPQQSAHRGPLSQEGYVNDYARVFDEHSKSRLETFLKEFHQKSNVEFAVVTIETTEGQPIFDSLALAKAWNVGGKHEAGQGLLLMLAKQDRAWRLQVSRSLEDQLPNDICKKLGDESADLYRQGRYAEGIEKYARAIVDRVEATSILRRNKSDN